MNIVMLKIFENRMSVPHCFDVSLHILLLYALISHDLLRAIHNCLQFNNLFTCLEPRYALIAFSLIICFHTLGGATVTLLLTVYNKHYVFNACPTAIETCLSIASSGISHKILIQAICILLQMQKT